MPQAAQRLMEQPALDPVELKEILADIVLAGQRGANVIRGVRGMLKRAGSDQVAVDVNVLVREVGGLLNTDTILKGISVRFELSPDLPPVFGERVQLQQVVLNLFMNAYEAMVGEPDGQRELVVRDQARGRPRRVRGLGHGAWAERRDPGANVRACLHDQAGRPGSGALDQPDHR